MSVSLPQLLIFALIVVLLFGTKRLANLGSDLGSALRGFKKSMNEDPEADKSGAKKDDSDDTPKTGS